VQEESTTNGRQLLTATRLKAARLCQRFHRIRYIDRVVPLEEPEPLRFGSLIHRGLEAWWKASVGDRLDAALAAIQGEADEFDRARAHALLCGYDTKYSGMTLWVLDVEVPFQFRLVNPDSGFPSRTWDLAGRIDAIVRTPDGRVLIVEHKTTSEDLGPGSEYWRRLQIDGQVSIYYEGAKALGYQVSGCLYDVIGKPAIRPGKATPPDQRKYTKDGRLYANQRETDETPDEFRDRLMLAISENPQRYYGQGEVVRLESECDDALADIWNLGQHLMTAQRTGLHPRNPDACVRWGRTCEYFDVCTGTADLTDPSRFTRLPSAHPELVNP
jgi:hypothetical protein